MTTIRIGTRRSQLAMWQANYVGGALCNVHPDLEVEIVGITTQGDRTLMCLWRQKAVKDCS